MLRRLEYFLRAIVDRVDFRMHDVVRDMALWVYLEKGEREDKHLVKCDFPFRGVVSKWETGSTISFRRLNIFENLKGEPKCDDLLSLDLSFNYFAEITNEIFA